MGLFDKNRKKIAALESTVREQLVALAESHQRSSKAIAASLTELGHVKAQAKQAQDEAAIGMERERQEWTLEKAHLTGRLEEQREKAARWDSLALGWPWHSGSSVEIDGIVYWLKEARTDNPLVNWRLPIKEGTEFP